MWCVHHQEGPRVGVIGQRQPSNQANYHNTGNWEPRGRTVLLGSLILLLSAREYFPDKVSRFVNMYVFLRQFISECWTGACSWVLESVPLLATQ